MKKHVQKWLAAAVLLLIVLIAGAAQADEHFIYVNVLSEKGSVTFKQKKAPLVMTNSKGETKTVMHYANYSIYRDVAKGNGGLKIYDFHKKTVTINLSKGVYLLHVEPGDLYEIKDNSGGGSWKGQCWDGSAPSWYIDDFSGCQINMNTFENKYNVPQISNAGLSTVKVTHMTTDGHVIAEESITLNSGTFKLAPRQDFAGYTPAGNGTQTVTVSEGVASPAYIVFTYTTSKKPAPTTALTGTGYSLSGAPVKIRVKYVSDDGYWNLKGTPQTATAGSTVVIYPEFTTRETEWGTYELTGAQNQSVSVSADGKPSTKTVTFTFTKKAKHTANPVAKTPGRYVTATGRVNVRKGPGVEYDIVTDMATGDIAEYLYGDKASNGQVWYRVRVVKNNREYNGWVSSKYATPN